MKDERLRPLWQSRMIARGKRFNGWLNRWLPVVIWMALIFCLSAQSTLPLPGVSWLDELIRIAGHFSEYAVLAGLAARATTSAGPVSWRRAACVLAVCLAYALSDEWHQSFVPGRDASLLDLAVDMLGALTGTAVYFRRVKRATWLPRARI